MDVNLIFQIAGVSILVTVIYTILQQAGRQEYAFTTLLLGLAYILMITIVQIAELFDKVRSVFNLY